MRKLPVVLILASSLIALAATSLSAQRPVGPGRGGPPPSTAAVAAQATPTPPDGTPRGGPGAAPGRFGRGGRAGRPGGPGPFAALNLTDDQRTKIRGLIGDGRDQAGQPMDELRLAQQTMRRELFADTHSNAKVTELSTKIATLQKQIAETRVKTLTSIAAVLTPEQRQIVRTTPGLAFDGAGRRGAGPALN